ncbi:hypothetical protein [Candidatus Clostridium stratigraminis]|uniref:VCBS repeat-containing protein n=1 Tax=Candidatus Clostridium stratigraminis TaxID=3381661 RepID=A0ABW8T8H9_9CLOT
MKKILIPIIALALFLLIPFYYMKAQQNNEEYKINSEFKCRALKTGKAAIILDYKFEDINGDNLKDNIILIGYRTGKANPSVFKDIKVILQDSYSKKYYAISVGKLNAVQNGKVFLGDFDGDKINDILVTIENGDCSYYSLFSFKNNKCKYLIDESVFFKGMSYNIDFVSNFKVKVTNKNLNDFYLLDVKNKKDTYINLGIYLNDGKLLKKNKGSYNSISSLIPIDEDKNGIYELKCIQNICGINRLDTLGYGKTIWKYNGRKMELKSHEFLEFASPGTKEKFQNVIPVGSFIK